MQVIPYTPQHKEVWNSLVNSSRNGTFLFQRQFMDYHADRFTDVSLIFYKGEASADGNYNMQSSQQQAEAQTPSAAKLLGVLPASAHGLEVVSHGGLTYGGFILSSNAHATDVGEMLELSIAHYSRCGYEQIIVKPVPYIYHAQPSDDELYWLFRKGARLISRSLSTAIRLDAPLPFSTLRRRKTKKALREGVTVIKTTDPADLEAFWNLLAEVLMQQHGKAPVHSLDELLLLQSRFPQNIQLHVAKHVATSTLLAGTVLFITPQVVHAQYIAASPRGREVGALDFLFQRLVVQFAATARRYLDFGISTEDHGHWLNEGLNFQKEGYGGRSIVYDSYALPLTPTSPAL